MTFISEFVSYGLVYVGILAVAVVGVICGKNLRIRKDAKEALLVNDTKED